MNIRKLIIIAIVAFCIVAVPSRAQFVDSSKGLMLMPSAEMEPEGTFMITNSFLNKHYTASPTWDYNTFGYGFSITIFSRMEVVYTMTIFNGDWDPNATTERAKIMKNQDRHFAARLNFVREGEFWKWMPSIVAGISDPVTGSGGDYMNDNVGETGNGYFNRMYLAAVKHFDTPWGVLGAHAAFQYTRRKDFSKTGPCAAVTWNPIWLNRKDSFLSSFRLIAEYDAKNVNLGLTASVFRDHFEAMFCLENCRWINASLRYKLIIK